MKIKKFDDFNENACANASNVAGMGAVVSAQPGANPGQTGTSGSGDIATFLFRDKKRKKGDPSEVTDLRDLEPAKTNKVSEKIQSYKEFENACANASNVAGMGAVVSAQPSGFAGVPGSTGSGDIGMPLGGAPAMQVPALVNKKKKKKDRANPYRVMVKEGFNTKTEEPVIEDSIIYDFGGDESYPSPWLKLVTKKGNFYTKLKTEKSFEARGENNEY